MPLETSPETVPAAHAPETDDLAGRGPQGTTHSAADTPPSPAAPEPSPAAPTVPTDPNLGAARPRPQPTAAEGWRGIREAAEALGYQFEQPPPDDNQALAALVRQAAAARQSDVYAQLGRQLAPQAPQIQQFLAGRQPPAAAPSEWERPEFDPRWSGLVDIDETSGLFVGKQGVPMDLVEKVNRYAQWVRRREERPDEFVLHFARQAAREVFQEQYAQASQQERAGQAVAQIRQQNAGWLYQADAQGNPVADAYGRPSLTPAGRVYAQHVATLEQSGMRDPARINQVAMQMLRADVYAAHQSQGDRSQQRNSPQSLAAFTPANSNPNAALTPTQRQDRGVPAPHTQGKSLMDVMREAVDQEGLTDQQFDMGMRGR